MSETQTEGRKGNKERLQAKFESVLAAFQTNLSELNARIDEGQVQRVKALKEVLAESHRAARNFLTEETRKEKEHLQQLEAFKNQCDRSEKGTVIPPFVDMFHMEKDTDPKVSLMEMETERFRLINLTVSLREHFTQRMEDIQACSASLEAREQERRDAIQRLLRDLMLTLAKISYTSVTSSHVIAQRVIHEVNEKLIENHLSIRTLLAQLSRREVLAQRQFGRTISKMYSTLLQRMTQSHTLWTRARLRSAVFRRPVCRMEGIMRVEELSASTRRDASTFLGSLDVLVRSLRESVPGEQHCGGSMPAGWLRLYDPDIHNAVFDGDPMSVVDEWLMKANVMVRNSLACCLSLSESIRAEENRLLASARDMKEVLLRFIEVIHTPLEGEVQLWQEASVTTTEMDDHFKPFVLKNIKGITHAQIEAENAVGNVIDVIEQEGEWFASTIRTGLQQSHTYFENHLLLQAQSVMRLFSVATQELATTASNTLGFVRAFYQRQLEASKDAADVIGRLEEQFQEVSQRLLHAASTPAAEELFAEGLHVLEKIAKTHSKFHRNTLLALAAVGQDAQDVFSEECGKLQRKIGLEEVSVAEKRFEKEREAKIDALLAQMVEEANNTKKKVKGDVEPPVITREMAEAQLPLEECDLPRVQASDGTTYYIVGDLALDKAPGELTAVTPQSNNKPLGPPEKKVTVAGGGAAAKKKTSKETVLQKDEEVVTMDFKSVYLPKLSNTIETPQNFITKAAIDELYNALRLEVMQWMSKLRSSSKSELHAYCESKKAESDKSTNETLRHHRRRPARFQADTFEARVRELENTSNVFEKHCVRVLERATKINAIWGGLHTNPAWAAEDSRVLTELHSLRDRAGEATSIAALQVQERRHCALTAQFVSSFDQRCRSLKAAALKEKESLETECRMYLEDRAKQLSVEPPTTESGGEARSIANDPLARRVSQILEQLDATMKHIDEDSKREQDERRKLVEEQGREYQAMFKQNSAELSFLNTAQEALARIKAQVQTAILYSNSTEDKLNEIISSLEKGLQKPVPRVQLAATMKVRLQRDYALETSKQPAYSEMTSEMVQEAEDGLQERLLACRAQLQRAIRSGDAAEVLGLLDSLREHLYVRGSALNALLSAVEMIQVSSDHYIEPRPLPKDAEGVATAKGKRTKSPHTSSRRTAPVITTPLPVTTSMETTFKNWVEEIKSEVNAAAVAHFAAYPQPLHRRLQGMQGGTSADILKLTETLCQQQESRVREHVEEATKRYHQQVQRVHICMESFPQYLTACLHALTVTAVERRIEAVLASFGELYSYSSSLKTIHQGELKVSLGNQALKGKLDLLAENEANRQQLTKTFTEQYWGFVLRELQDESGLHTVRCAQTVSTFFNLFKGIIAPDQLVPMEVNVSAGQHRGLKHLMQMRDRERQLVTIEHREVYLQETMPLLKQGPLSKGPTSSRGRGSEAGQLTVPTYKEVEYEGLPLNELKAVEDFVTVHPETALEPLPSARSFYPMAELLAAATQANAAAAAAANKGAKKKMAVASDLEPVVVMTPTFVVPNTGVHQDTIALIRDSVQTFLASSREVVNATNKAFGGWRDREEQWSYTWQLMLQRILGSSSTSGAASPKETNN